jgi:hypothetical protein
MVFKRIINWYEEYERWFSSLSLVGGFIFDAIALKRVDLFIENFWIVVHLLIAACGIVLLNLFEKGRAESHISEEARSRIHFWIIVIIQFAFGGLLSTFLVFYFRSGSLATSWPFMLLLVIAFASNEIFKKHYIRLSFQISILFLSIYSFAIFLVPVVLHQIGDLIFLLSGVVSLIILGLFLFLLHFLTREHFHKNRRILLTSISAIVVAMNVLYFTNIIPPIPLSLKELGVYHSVSKLPNGQYALQYEQDSWLDFILSRSHVHLTSGSPLYVFSAVFSPTKFDTRVIHEWQYYDSKNKKWITSTRVTLGVNGGRDGGYRTYSLKNSVFPGSWRVNVLTPSGLYLGRVSFSIENAPETPDLRTAIN